MSTGENWLQKAEAKPILPTLEFFNWAKSKNFAVFFITGNREKFREPYTNNLRRAGFTSWDSLYMKAEDSGDPTSVHKSKVRKTIIENGYYIIANIDGQESDLDGG